MEPEIVAPDEKLTFRHIEAYLVEGLQAPTDGAKQIYSDKTVGKKVYLTDRSDDIWSYFDTAQSLAYSIVTTIVGIQAFSCTAIAERLAETAKERLQKFNDQSAFLIVEAAYATEGARLGIAGKSVWGNFGLALPIGFREEVEISHKPFFEQAQSFLYFAFPSISGLAPTGNCIVADHPKGYPLYVLTSSASGRITVSAPMPADPADGFELLEALFQHSGKLQNFQPTFRLFAGSATNVRDNFRAFLFAFTALEAFLSRFFKNHRQRLLEHRQSALAREIERYIEEIEQRRKDQGRTEDDFPIAYKFALVASYLGSKRSLKERTSSTT
jgi:hypothetical protein